MRLETAQATATTRPALTPSSWTRRRLSTAPRICRPSGVSRMRTTRASRTTAVTTTVLSVIPLIGVPATRK